MSCGSDTRLFYGLEDDEILSDSIQECVEKHFDDMESPPETVEVGIYRHKPPSIDRDWLLERVIEELEDNYGNPGELSHIEITEEMLAAADAFTVVVIQEFINQGGVWRCDKIDSTVVRVADYLGDI